MERFITVGILLVVNVVLTVWLATGSASHSPQPPGPVEERRPVSLLSSASPRQTVQPIKPAAPQPEAPKMFDRIYSTDPATFAANLRRIGCPEATLKDLVRAEVDRRFQAKAEALRPTPADHVPLGWSPQIHEPTLVQRREQARELARQKAALLQNALGYEVAVVMPRYGLTRSEQQFEELLSALSPTDSATAQQIQQDYQLGVRALQARTQGFWQSEDQTALEELKGIRTEALHQLLDSP